jgi:iron complex outermembrane recepter protein
MFARTVSAAALACALAAPALATEVASEAGEAAASAASADDQTIIVTGRAQKLYRVEETVTGKLPAEPLASSQTITVITEELIEDQGARDAQDLYRNISGVSFFSYAGVTARGFRQEEIFYDGLRGDPYAGFAVPQLFNVDRIEFLKGPAGMLYGPGAPGGLFNYITKKPEDRFSAELSLIAGTEDRYGGSAEITGPIGRAGLAGRAGLFFEDRGLFRFNAASRTLIADGGLSYDFGPAKVIAQVTYYDQELDSHRLRGVPVDNRGNFRASRRWNHNEPDDFQNLRSDVAQIRVEAQPLASLSFDATLRYNDARERQQYHEPRVLFDSDGDGQADSITRQFRDQEREEDYWSLGANAIWSADFGSVRNRVLAGIDYFTGDQLFLGRSVNGTTAAAAGRPRPLSLLNPDYGVSDSSTYILPAFVPTPSETRRRGFYLLDEATVGPVVLVGGIRHDSFEDEESGRRFKGDGTTYRLGGVYRVRPDVSLFAQYSTSFEPQSVFEQDARAGGPFEPTTGRSFEGGVKTALMNGRVQSTLTAYRIKRRNILQADPRGDVGGDGIDDLVSVGEVTSKGVEFDIAADVTPNWVLITSYGYNDARITADSGTGGITNSVGDRFANAPEHQLGFWTRYQIPAAGLAFALGGDHVSSRRSLSNQRVKPYTVFDASIIYETGPWRALVRVDNIFDKTYAVSGFTLGTGHFPGEPRSLFLEVTRRW